MKSKEVKNIHQSSEKETKNAIICKDECPEVTQKQK